MSRLTIRLLALLTIAAGSPPTLAQEEFRLNEGDSWERVSEPDRRTAEGQLASAREALAAGQLDRAILLAGQWIERHERHPYAAEAYLVRGDALVAQNELYDALFDYEYITRIYPGSEAFVTALEREYDIADRYASGLRRKLFGLRIVDASDIAEELLIRIQERLPGSRLAERSALRLADFYFSRRQMELAAEMYAIVLENFPQSEHAAVAKRRLIYAHLAGFKGPEFDPRGLIEARNGLENLKRTDPVTADQMGADALVIRIDESVAAKMLVNAQWYMRTGDPIAAEFTIRRLVREHPHSVAAADAVQLTEKLLPMLPENLRRSAPDYQLLRNGTPDEASPDDAAVHSTSSATIETEP